MSSQWPIQRVAQQARLPVLGPEVVRRQDLRGMRARRREMAKRQATTLDHFFTL
jgi:hypothetical protein